MRQSSKEFKEKRKKASETYDRIQNYKIWFLINEIYEFFRFLIFPSKFFIQNFDQFEVDKNETEDFFNKKLAGDVGAEPQILKKRYPKEDTSITANKCADRWYSKLQNFHDASNEIMAAEISRFLLGKKYSAKYRLVKNQQNLNIYSVSKFFKDFKRFEAILTETNQTSKIDNINAYLQVTESLEGFEEMLAVSLLLGRYDCTSKNWGIVTNRDGSQSVATFDFGRTFNSKITAILPIMLNMDQGHHKDRFISKKFIDACWKIIEKFENNHDHIQCLLDSVVTRY